MAKQGLGIGGHTRPNNGQTVEWLTPPRIVKALGPFDLDPCAPVHRPWDTATEHFTVEDNGLIQPWHGRVWLNPPYGTQTAGWLSHLADHGNGIAIIFARTETRMFHEHVWGRADGILFFNGRLYFHYPNGDQAFANAGGPSCLIAYGQQNVEALRRSGLSGVLVTNWERTTSTQKVKRAKEGS